MIYCVQCKISYKEPLKHSEYLSGCQRQLIRFSPFFPAVEIETQVGKLKQFTGVP